MWFQKGFILQNEICKMNVLDFRNWLIFFLQCNGCNASFSVRQQLWQMASKLPYCVYAPFATHTIHTLQAVQPINCKAKMREGNGNYDNEGPTKLQTTESRHLIW